MVEYIYFVKCPNCEDEHFSFFDEAKEFALGCLSKKPIITQVEVCRNDFGECTDSCDLGTVWSWEKMMNDIPAEEPAISVFTKDDLKYSANGEDPEFDTLDNSLDNLADCAFDCFDDTDLEEGIFDSKEKKQKNYAELIKTIFGTDLNIVVSNTVSNASDLIQEVADTIGEDSGSKNLAKSIINTIKNAKATINKTPHSLVKAIISLGQKYEYDSLNLTDLKTFISKVGKLQTTGKDGHKAMIFLFDKVNKALSVKIDSTIKFLAKEYGLITESKKSYKKPIPYDMTIGQLVEEMEKNESTIECACCNELFDKSECRKEVELGYLCPRCEAAIKSRGETLTFEETPLEENFNGKEYVTFEYNDLSITVQSPKYDVDDWNEVEHSGEYSYKVTKDDVATAIWENFITEDDVADVEGGLETLEDNDAWNKFLETHFDDLFDKYYSKLLDYFKEDAIEEFEDSYTWNDYESSLEGAWADERYERYRDSLLVDENFSKKVNIAEDLDENDIDTITAVVDKAVTDLESRLTKNSFQHQENIIKSVESEADYIVNMISKR